MNSRELIRAIEHYNNANPILLVAGQIVWHDSGHVLGIATGEVNAGEPVTVNITGVRRFDK